MVEVFTWGLTGSLLLQRVAVLKACYGLYGQWLPCQKLPPDALQECPAPAQ